MKWWHALALLAVGFGVGRADVSLMGTAKWEVGSETEKELRALDLKTTHLGNDKRFGLVPTTGDEESRRMVAVLKLRSEALETEAACQAAFQRHPDTLSHQYLLLTARGLTDRAINLTVWHQLAALPVDVLPCENPQGTVKQRIAEAKVRMSRRDALLDIAKPEGGWEFFQTASAFDDLLRCQW